MRTPTSLAGLALLCWFAPACGSDAGRPEDGPRLVVLYTACTVNKSLLAPYGADERATPHLARFARAGLVFDAHRTEASTSGLAFAALFSGAHADVHGVYQQPTPLEDDVFLIGEAFAAAGWDTLYWSGHKMAAADLGYAQGSGTVLEPDRADRAAYTATGPELLTILERLRAEPEYRAFLQINLVLSHSPYALYLTPGAYEGYAAAMPDAAVEPGRRDGLRRLYVANRLPLQWDYERTVARLGLSAEDEAALARVLEADYRAGLWDLDRSFGELVDAIDGAGLAAESLIAFTADHGETLVRPGHPFRWSHTLQLTPDVLDVPWIVRGPRLGLAGRYERVTRSIDVFPTLAGWAGVPLPKSAPISGVDLGAAVAGEVDPPRLVALSHTALLRPTRLEKLSRFPDVVAWNRAGDPEGMWVTARDDERELTLARPDGSTWTWRLDGRVVPTDEVPADLRGAIERYKAGLVAGWRARRPDELDPDEALRRLRELGYVDD